MTIYKYIRTCMHVKLHRITLYFAVGYITLHYITLDYTTSAFTLPFRYMCIYIYTCSTSKLRNYVALHNITLHSSLHLNLHLYLHYVTSRFHYTYTRITLHYITLHYVTLHCTALRCIALHCMVLPASYRATHHQPHMPTYIPTYLPAFPPLAIYVPTTYLPAYLQHLDTRVYGLFWGVA